eukprot:1501166-Rhodomonas_salina.2
MSGRYQTSHSEGTGFGYHTQGLRQCTSYQTSLRDRAAQYSSGPAGPCLARAPAATAAGPCRESGTNMTPREHRLVQTRPHVGSSQDVRASWYHHAPTLRLAW